MENYESAEGPLAEIARATGLRSSVSAPITVEGRVWGLITASWKGEESPPPETEERMAKFAGLLDTAIANTEARAEVERLADEQAALRRVATLVAEGAPPTAVFDAVAAETEGLLGADRVSLSRYEPGAEIAVLAHRGSGAELVPAGSRLSLEGDSVQEMVRRTERPARMENFEEAHGPIAEVQRTMGVRGVVAVPVVVDGRVWGVIGASWVGEESPSVDTEERMAQFAGLLETAIANADSRGQLDASRARLVTEADEARRRLVRDLHDGAQQRLVHTIVTLKLAERAFGRHDGEARQLVGDALEQAEQSNRELRELAHGILPAVLERGGLRAGVDAFVGAARPTGRARCSGRAISGRDRGQRLLHRGRGAHQRRQARARRACRGHRIRARTGCSTSRSVTTGSEAPIPTGTVWWGWATGRPRSVGGCKSRARPAAAHSWPPRCRSRPASVTAAAGTALHSAVGT